MDKDKEQRYQQRMARKKTVVEEQIKQADEERGVLIVNTGNGKGKSSAAFGVVARALGHDMKVGIVQFIKGRGTTGEETFFTRIPEVEYHVTGDGFTWDTNNPEQDRKTSQEIWEFSKEKIRSQEYDLVVLDEISYCCGYGWLGGKEIADFIRQEKPSWMHLILTGREAPIEIIQLADTVTEMRAIKHAFDSGIKAEQGIEF